MGSKQKERVHAILYWGLPVLAVILIVVAWVLFSAQHPELMPDPVSVWKRLIKTFVKPIGNTNLFGHAWASLSRVLLALLIAWAFGIFFGILIGWNRTARAIFGSIFEVIRPIPPIAWIPIMIMWFGIGELPKILLVFIGTFVPLVINTSAGISMVDKINISVGKVFGGSNMQILKDIVIPTALPSIFAGIRTSVSSGWTTVLAAEMLAAQRGLGSLVTKGWQGSDMALVLVAVITIAIIGSLLSFLLNKLEKVVCPWNSNK
ncbi:ABC transporter permease [Caproiciproducens faecalis]|uniref:ABC transporter permease n=1 Tax=Caproiciproducens faecalis TaxID=2820301 RepID=A0ABS7DMS4_9FIRM|nr:ABC transporter permease [Caproiciproducens faecalis]MBW7572372.1 ABC transporter permease [Caproiciproducens faecalis]